MIEIDNLRIASHNALNRVHPSTEMWSCFVARIDGVALPPRLNETHKARLALLAERANRPASGLIALGKEWLSNMQSDLEAFIPSLAKKRRSSVIRQYTGLKSYTLAVLAAVAAGDGNALEVINHLDAKQIVSGRSVSARKEEIKLIKDYEQAIIALSTKLSVDPQGLSALQFHLALDSLSESKPKDKGGHAKGQRK